ncbi:ribosomal protein L11 methyltransferase [Vulcanibacillus modesticaldus]|uniref:Ribosomal protein L11 methyltransferase n=1 Tax=Vulcanibacillus modesticaldus TaxID=337097 RepID=A0A1D2YSD3_9BACI|nr:50S ribosomal protein L11 methyltransferase [Vulcanibacillus modesticaldus]OEF96942.1 ribosomal protein L11 methyltransferase [Vulcanibacillus modesticaldus]
MKWSEISIHTTQEAIEAVANILHEAGAGGVIIEDPEILEREWETPYGEVYQLSPEDFPEEGVVIKAYFPLNSYLMETVEQIKLAINNLLTFDINIGDGKISISEVNEEDWASGWKKYYKPVKIADKILITPTWEEVEPKSDEIVIELDPGMAFGTGTHPTTVMCIQALEKVIKGDEEVIDVGCGTGVLSIAAAKLGAKHILALDLDEVAIKSAKLNAKINNVGSVIEVKQNNLLDNIDKRVDLVMANILAEVIIRFTSDVARVLKPNGIYITSGIIGTKAELVKDVLIRDGFIIEETLRKDDWVAFIAKRA